MGIKLTLDEKKWHGCRYYIVRPFMKSNSLKWNNNKWTEIHNWCSKTYGKQGDVWDPLVQRWYYNDARFWFLYESDRTMFILRWS